MSKESKSQYNRSRDNEDSEDSEDSQSCSVSHKKRFIAQFCANLMIGFKMSVTKVTVEMFTEALNRIADLETRAVVLEEQLAAKRPAAKSENSMTEEHAFRVKFGDLKDLKHGKAAEALGLSYGQVFSCRGGYTFKTVTKDWKAAEVATAAE